MNSFDVSIISRHFFEFLKQLKVKNASSEEHVNSVPRNVGVEYVESARFPDTKVVEGFARHYAGVYRPKAKLISFPDNHILRGKWLRQLRFRNEWRPKPYDRICALHFTQVLLITEASLLFNFLKFI